MKHIYHLSIFSRQGERRRNLDIHYEKKEKATAELKRWADKFRKEWQVPEKSDDDWDLDEKYSNEENLEFHYIGKDNSPENRRHFSGRVSVDMLIEDGEEVLNMCGEVWAAGNNPDILFVNSSPVMKNNASFSGYFPIDISKKERSDFSQVTGGAVIQNEEKAREYYNIRSRIIDKEIHSLKK